MAIKRLKRVLNLMISVSTSSLNVCLVPKVLSINKSMPIQNYIFRMAGLLAMVCRTKAANLNYHYSYD